jgi:hypothetical protein
MNTHLSKLMNRSVVKWLSAAFLLVTISFSATAQPRLSTETPIGFFTNFAGKLLQSEMGLDLNHIQIYPTNQYTPAVHRLLQVTANIYDCTTNRADLTDYPYLPTIFRPQFTNDNGIIYITGYVEETGTNVIAKKPLDLLNPDDRANIQQDDNIYGIPLVIGAKKGLPNFNEFSMAAVVKLTRRMQIQKPTAYDSVPSHWDYRTQYSINISNLFAVEMWNSYSNPFPRAVSIMVTNELTMVLTNDLGVMAETNLIIGSTVLIPANVWPGATNLINSKVFSFAIPLLSNITFVPSSSLVYDPPGLTTNSPTVFETNSGTNVQNWGISITNRLRVMTLDEVTGRIIDYVQLNGLDDHRDIMKDLVAQAPLGSATPASPVLWDSTQQPNIPQITRGMWQQVFVSLGSTTVPLSEWIKYMINPPLSSAQKAQVAAFQAFYAGETNQLAAQTPFIPTGEMLYYLTWQANDPLVHYLSSDLLFRYLGGQRTPVYVSLSITNLSPNILSINDRFSPWGGNPRKASDNDAHPTDIAFKDPLITRPDDWDFPSNAPLSFNWLGRVHRGTPWQTIYLKSPSIPTNQFADWVKWTGDHDIAFVGQQWVADAPMTHPTNDWNLARLMISLLNTNRPRDLVSVNQGNLFQGFAQGLNVLTNTTSDIDFDSAIPISPQFNTVSMLPDSPQAATILAGRDSQRSLQPGNYFHDPIDILSTPELTVNSPWLSLSSTQQRYGISDTAYEMIPSQILPLLRADSVGTTTTRVDGQLELQFTGYDGYAYQVQSSTDLVNWITIDTQYPTNGTFSIVDPAGTSAEHRYYRSVLAP